MIVGWRVFWLLASLETAVFAVALAGLGTDEPGLRALVRLTVRVSFLVFIAVYAAAPLRELFRSPATRWLARNRRYLGVSFAWAHALHALAIALLVLLLGDAFKTSTATLVGGGLGYLLIAGMAASSFDRTARALGPRRWALLHRAGLHWLWFIFALDWTGAAIAKSPLYLPFAALTWAAAAARLAALLARRRGCEPLPHPA
jgi:methionine sulfoxide reductase heme-binding subunit